MSKKLDFSISLKLLNENFKKGINNVKNQLNNLKGWIASAFAVGSILDFTKSIASVGSAFQDQMARVKAVSGATKKEFEEMRKEAEKLGATTKYSATQAAEALENLVRNGLSAKDATKSLAKVLELAGSQAIDLAQAADIATAVMNGFGKSVEDLGRVNDILASTTANSATNVTDLSEALKNVAPIANLLGASMEEVCAAIGTLADVGIKGSQAGNALRGILNRLIKPTKQGQDALDRYGISISEAEIKANGLTATLEKLSKVNMSLADQKALFGEEYGAAGAALTSNIEKYTTKKTTIENSSGEAGRQFNEGQGEFKTALDTLKSTWESFLNGIFDKTKGLFTGLINKATSFINILKDFPYLLTAIGFTVGKTINSLSKIIQSTLTEGIVDKVTDKLSREMSVIIDYVHIGLKDLDPIAIASGYKPINIGNVFEGAVDVFHEQEQIILDSLDKVDKETKKKLEKILKYISEYKETLLKIQLENNKRLDNKEKIVKLDKASKEFKNLEKDIEKSGKALEKYQEKLAKIFIDIANDTVLGADFYIDPKKLFGTTEIEKQALERKKKFDKFLDSVSNKAVSVFGAIGKSIKSVYNFFGGWIGILTTVGSALYGFYKNWKAEQDKVFNELKEGQKTIINQYSAMETQVMSLIGVMRQYNTESAAWKAAKDALTSGYPELFKNMNLERIHIKATGDEYRNLKDRIREVIKEQREYMLNEHKREAVSKLQADYQEKTEGLYERLSKIFTGATDSKGNTLTKEAAQIIAAQIRSDITAMLAEGLGKSDIEEYLKKMFAEYGLSIMGTKYTGGSSFTGAQEFTYDRTEEIARTFYNKYQRYGKSIESIGKLEVKDQNKPIRERIESLVNSALEYFDFESKDITKTGKAKNQSEDEINSEIDSLRKRILDQLVEDLKDISTEIEGKSALDYAKDNKLFEKLLPKKKKGNKGGTTTTEETTISAGQTKTPKQLFDETKKYIDALKDSGIIDENEYRKRLLSAYESYISSLENEHKTDKESIDTIRELNKQRDDLKKQIEETEKAEAHWKEITDLHARIKEELIEKDRERLDQADKSSKSIENAFRRDKYNYEDNKPNRWKWDVYNTSNGFENTITRDEQQLERLEELINDLSYIAGDKFEIDLQLEELEKLKGDGVDALREELEKLSVILGELEDQANSLNDKIQLKKAKKELDDLNKEVWKQGYNGVKTYFNSITSLGNAFISLRESWHDMSDTEQVLATFDAIFNTIDTVWGLVEAFKAVSDVIELIKYKKQVLSSIEKKELPEKIAITQAEAAAVVTAEAEKTAAITGALTAQTSAALAAKAAQTKAATVAMAAESTAAYAGIPFAGVGLAAAQIAEMEALIAAAAALPMFAEGGIVGGSKYIGDQNLARVNSGEMIINGSQQRKLWDAISNNRLGGNTLSGDVEFKISGQVLRGVLNNHDKKISKIK